MKEIHFPSQEYRSKLARVNHAIFDIDNTLVFATNPDFYQVYGEKVEKAIQIHYGIDEGLAKSIADFYRVNYGGGEQALFRGDAHLHFENCPQRPTNVSLLYDLLTEIDPTERFTKQTKLREHIGFLRSLGLTVTALTSSPDILSRRILEESGYIPENDFDSFIAYSREDGPPKMISEKAVFQDLLDQHNASSEEVIAIGDSLHHDVLPAISLGMLGCLLTGNIDTDELRFIMSIKTTTVLQEIIKQKKK